MTQIIKLAPASNSCREIAAQLLAWLAYPDECSADKRISAERRLLAAIVEEAERLDFGGPASPSQVSAIRFARRSPSGMKSIHRRLQHRLNAGNTAAAHLFAATGARIGWPKALERPPTLDDLFHWMASNENDDPRNVERRQWNQTMPAMNLAIALCVAIQELRRAGRPMQSILHLGCDSHLLAALINCANMLGPEVEAHWANRAGAFNQPHFLVEFNAPLVA